MKSTIKIALGQSNEPVINMVAVMTDDIRDQLCRQWIERLGGESNLAYCRFGEQSKDTAGDYCVHMEISPLGPKSHILNIGLITDIYNHFCKGVDWFSMCTTGDHIWFENKNQGITSVQLNRENLVSLSTVELVQAITNNINSISSLAEPAKASNRLPSKYQVDDFVETDDIYDGQVVGIRFTIGKVYYDILDKLTGNVIRDVDSALVTNQDMIPVKLSQA